MPVVLDVVDGYIPDVDVQNCCTWYSEDLTEAVIRTTYPVTGLKALNTPIQSILNKEMPVGRVGGL